MPFPSPLDLSNPGIEPMSPVLQADSFLTEAPGKPTNHISQINIKLTSYLRISALGRTESQPLCKLIAATLIAAFPMVSSLQLLTISSPVPLPVWMPVNGSTQ